MIRENSLTKCLIYTNSLILLQGKFSLSPIMENSMRLIIDDKTEKINSFKAVIQQTKMPF